MIIGLLAFQLFPFGDFLPVELHDMFGNGQITELQVAAGAAGIPHTEDFVLDVYIRAPRRVQHAGFDGFDRAVDDITVAEVENFIQDSPDFGLGYFLLDFYIFYLYLDFLLADDVENPLGGAVAHLVRLFGRHARPLVDGTQVDGVSLRQRADHRHVAEIGEGAAHVHGDGE